jgi:S-DNA-T family DNA segregation ATPase FtsK/SpoIIIE
VVKKDRVQYTFHNPYGVSIDDWEKNEQYISDFFMGNIRIKDMGHMLIQVTKYKDSLKTKYPFNLSLECPGEVSFPVGMSQDGPIIHSMTRGYPHLGCGGATGTGKSTFEHVTLTYLLLKKPNTIIHGIDLKGSELKAYRNIPRVEDLILGPDYPGVLSVLKKLVDEMEKRNKLFDKYKGVAKIEKYNEKVSRKDRLPYRVLFIDEYSLITGYGEIEQLILRLLGLGSSAGIYTIIITQHPSVKIISGDLKANITTWVAFATRNGTDSRVLIDQDGAEELRGEGNGLYVRGRINEEFQGYWLDPDDVPELLKDMYVEEHKQERKSDIGGIEYDTD